MHRNNIAMLRRIITLSLLIIIQFLSLIHSSNMPPRRPFNLSHFLNPRVTAFIESNAPPRPPNFLQGVFDAIAKKEKWASEDTRVSGLDVNKAKYRPEQRYEFRVRVGKAEVLLKMNEARSGWKKFVTPRKNATSNFEALALEIGSKAVIESFKIEGPFELRVAGDDDQLSLMLPLNTSHSGLRRISVSEGITVEVEGAQEISLFHPSRCHQLPCGAFIGRKWNEIGSVWHALCAALLPVRILGSASVVAYRSQRPAAIIQTAFSSSSAIELLPEKCYVWPNYEKPRLPFSSLSSRITLLERVLRNFLKERGSPDAPLGSLKSRVRASNIFHFQLELERDVRRNDTLRNTLAEWRTRPTIERLRFDVFARIEGEILKPLVIKKVRPFIDTDSFAWSSLLSNISFTKLPSALVPPEALTLDVKWQKSFTSLEKLKAICNETIFLPTL